MWDSVVINKKISLYILPEVMTEKSAFVNFPKVLAYSRGEARTLGKFTKRTLISGDMDGEHRLYP